MRQSVRGEIQSLERVASVGGLDVFRAPTLTRRLGGIVKQRHNQYRVVDREGIIRLQLKNGDCRTAAKREVMGGLKDFFDKHIIYGDAGREFPDLFLIFRGKILDMSGLINLDQIVSLCRSSCRRFRTTSRSRR